MWMYRRLMHVTAFAAAYRRHRPQNHDQGNIRKGTVPAPPQLHCSAAVSVRLTCAAAGQRHFRRRVAGRGQAGACLRGGGCGGGGAAGGGGLRGVCVVSRRNPRLVQCGVFGSGCAVVAADVLLQDKAFLDGRIAGLQNEVWRLPTPHVSPHLSPASHADVRAARTHPPPLAARGREAAAECPSGRWRGVAPFDIKAVKPAAIAFEDQHVPAQIPAILGVSFVCVRWAQSPSAVLASPS